MKKQRKRLSPELAKRLGLKIKKNDSDGRYARYSLSEDQMIHYVELASDGTNTPLNYVITTTKDYSQEVLSAVGSDGGIMDIDSYCEYYNLPRVDITSYKLITHTGTPYYNIVFRENEINQEEINYDFIEELVKKHIKPISHNPVQRPEDLFDRVIYTDVHIGMHPNKSGKALYGGKWDEEELIKRATMMVDHILTNRHGDLLVIDDLGDLLDGWDGHTVRKGHSLPQNMTNQEMFDVAVRFKVFLADALHDKYNKIIMNNICEDNHSGSFGYIVNSASKSIIEQKYSHIEVVNHNKFMNHYYVGHHCFVISHGKDSHALKFGFKPFLESKQIEKIDQYLKNSGIYKKAKYIEFSKGDSHQMLFDYCTSDDFDYCNYPAFSPSSEWVQTNFKKGRSGFVMQVCEYDSPNRVMLPYFF